MSSYPYKTSKNYRKLFDLATSGYTIICMMDIKVKDEDFTVQIITECSAKKYNNGETEGEDYFMVIICTIGSSFIETGNKTEFINQCTERNVSFMIPSLKVNTKRK